MASRSRAVLRVPTCPAYVPVPFGASAAKPALYPCEISSVSAVSGTGAVSRAQVEVGIVHAVDRA